MKKTVGAFCLFFISQIAFGQLNSRLAEYAGDVSYTTDNKLTFVRLNENHTIDEAGITGFINSVIFNNGENTVSIQKTERDALGFTHIKFNIFQKGAALANKVIIAHCSNGKLVSLNGDLSELGLAENGFSLTEQQALAFALAKVNAKKYKWENKEEESQMREVLNDPNFSYAPRAEKMVFEKEGNLYNAYRFNIYAETPLYRANVFVDASNGEILDEQNLICTTDVPATAVTKYSGTQPFITDLTGGFPYRLRETQRGLGVETYNMKNTSVYSSTDFTNATTSWTSTGVDQAATDAHWGAEMTYDYYFTQHNRSSVDNAGYKLLSYVHYMNGYTNAFWDGQRMTYGDGDGSSFKIFTALDICGHEITHGLTAHTSNLNYNNESGALNESFSDIFGVSIENYGRPGNWNWKIGEDITPGFVGLRSMSSPNAFGNPDTYGGTYYFNGTADNGGVHTNSSVGNFWFYLLTSGGSGTNDLSHAYSVTGIGISDAAKIAFRALTVYFTPTTNYATARLLTIQAAIDLFGNCSPEVIATTQAWYAVGVGASYLNGVAPNFLSNITSYCSAPANVNFINTTVNGLSYVWDFGDGSATSTATNVSHTYSNVGVYSVKLKATGCASALDSITKASYIVINPPVSSPVVSNTVGCENSPITVNGNASSTLVWYDSPTGGSELGSGNSFTTPNLTTTTTFYAANTLTLAAVTGGILSNTGGTYSNSNANYQVFDVLQPGVLNSVVMYAQTVGNRVIQLRNAANVVIYSTTVYLGIGATTVTLNYNLTPGTNYRLGLSNTSSSNVYRTTTGVAYPYNIGGCVNITTSNTGNSVYYYFYKWNISKQECASPRVPVVVTVVPGPVVTMDNVPANPICTTDMIDLQGSPAGGIYGGNGITGNIFNASSSGAGSYNVTYMYTDANSCTNIAGATLIVEECTGISKVNPADNSVQFYPNPAKDNLVVSGTSANTKIKITDAIGRVVLTKELNTSEEKIQLDGISNGIYIISVQDGKGQTIKTSKLIKE